MELFPGKLYKITSPLKKKIYTQSLISYKKEYYIIGIIPPNSIVMLLDKGKKIPGLYSMYEYKILYKDIIGYIDLPCDMYLKLVIK